ncbi:MAG TPA: sodium/proton-translocating pyrophosphatase, partial [Tepiditoga sp.]|nr:sodium/proton-translocating pyrophosphatase [Tepiditoga sp.]
MSFITNMSGVIAGAIGMIFTVFLTFKVLEKDPGNEKMVKISNAVQVGAKAFLISEYKILYIIVVLFALFLGIVNSWAMACAFVFGATLSVLAGYFGMTIATRANTRTAQAATKSLGSALKVAFNGGAVMGMTV